MTVKKLIKKLKQMDQNLEVLMFAHDHDPEDPDQGAGYVCSAWEQTDTDGYTFVALHA